MENKTVLALRYESVMVSWIRNCIILISLGLAILASSLQYKHILSGILILCALYAVYWKLTDLYKYKYKYFNKTDKQHINQIQKYKIFLYILIGINISILINIYYMI